MFSPYCDGITGLRKHAYKIRFCKHVVFSCTELAYSRGNPAIPSKKRLEVGFELLRDLGPGIDGDVAGGVFGEAAAERRIVGETTLRVALAH